MMIKSTKTKCNYIDDDKINENKMRYNCHRNCIWQSNSSSHIWISVHIPIPGLALSWISSFNRGINTSSIKANVTTLTLQVKLLTQHLSQKLKFIGKYEFNHLIYILILPFMCEIKLRLNKWGLTCVIKIWQEVWSPCMDETKEGDKEQIIQLRRTWSFFC
jgi:hypothetical protein